MIKSLLKWFRPARYEADAPLARPKLFFNEHPDVVYAIGDVHGCYDHLRRLEDQIFEDARTISGKKWIVMLGDYIDRGPKSVSVIDHLMAPVGEGFERFCIAGNHEEAFLDFLDEPSPSHGWLHFGGVETLRSYGISKISSRKDVLSQLLESYVPDEHIRFLTGLPSLIACPGLCFAHGGIEPGVPLAEQSDRVLLWKRPSAGDAPVPEEVGLLVHGHTPVADVDIALRRINVDTGAYMSDRLSAVKLQIGNSPIILRA